VNVLVVNGPNLNLLGTREPGVYGTTTLPELDELCVEWGAELGLTVTTFQSNHEGAIIDRIQAAAADGGGVVINAGALTHYSYAIYDALVAVGLPTVEVHISNIHAREEWRRQSVIQPACLAQISGEGLDGYRRALAILTDSTRRG
jgi:3-dehydroquinate dehydratase-2